MAQFALGGPLPVNMQGIPLGVEPPPPAANIVNGYATTDGATLVTLAANMVMVVSISISCAQSTASTTGRPTVTVVGTGSPTPATNSVIAALAVSTNNGVSNATNAAVFNEIYVYSGSSSVILKLNLGGASNAAAVVNGVILQ